MVKVLSLRTRRSPTSAVTPLSDRALVAACGVGEVEALGQLYDRHQAMVRRFLFRTGCPSEVIDDLVQQAFLGLWNGAARFRGQAQVSTYLLGIAHNLVRHHFRDESRRQAALLDWSKDQGSAPSPAGVTEAKASLERAQETLRQLPPGPRAAFVLCVLEDLSLEEASQVLAVRRGTLGRWIHEARAALRDAVEGRDD